MAESEIAKKVKLGEIKEGDFISQLPPWPRKFYEVISISLFEFNKFNLECSTVWLRYRTSNIKTILQKNSEVLRVKKEHI